MKKKYIAILLSIVMFFNVIPSTALNAMAQEIEGIQAESTEENPGQDSGEATVIDELEENSDEETTDGLEEDSDEEVTGESEEGSDEEVTDEPEENLDEEITSESEEGLDEETIDESETEQLGEELIAAEFSVYQQLYEAESLLGFWQIMMAEENKEAVLTLTEEEITNLKQKVVELYELLEKPTADDLDYKEMLLETFDVLPNANEEEVTEETEEESGEEPVVLDTEETFSQNTTWNDGKTVGTNDTYNFENGAVITLGKPIVIQSNCTLIIKGYGSLVRAESNKGPLVTVQSGGTLIVEGDVSNRFTFDGKSYVASDALIRSSGTVNLSYAAIQNGKNRSVNASNKPNGSGGGIYSTGALIMDHCVVTRNTASVNGGGLLCSGTMTISNSEISYNYAVSSETGMSQVNCGRGGGFHLNGENAKGSLENVQIIGNAAMYYGGGGQVSGKATLEMKGTTTFSGNQAILHGAGALHVTGAATFTMVSGTMDGNTAQTVGGAIHSSYDCNLQLNAGVISNNISNGRGGGVHINTGGALTLGDGLQIIGNKVYNQRMGTYAMVDETGDHWSGIKYEGPGDNNGYGGGVLIDSGTCTVSGAKISGNEAEVGGGGIALVMLNASESGLKDLEVVQFTMNSGEISGNKSAENGAGVYLMSNKVKEIIIQNFGAEGTDGYNTAVGKLSSKDILTETPKAIIEGGTVSGNIATVNGGGLYLGENTKFVINAGLMSANAAVDGAGAYIARGTAEINGGQISNNTASNNGGAICVYGTVQMTAGVIQENSAKANGGAVYANEGAVTVSTGSLLKNTANNGGAVYANGGAITVTNAEFSKNTAIDGGAVYANGGAITVINGSLSENTANNGGAIYANRGSITVEHGSINTNVAKTNGGAIYMAGDASNLPKLIVESGEIKGNHATAEVKADSKDDKKSGNGGAIFVTNGIVYIGLSNCSGGDDNTLHTVKGEDRHHPIIKGNVAENNGGGISVENQGEVHFYCGNASENTALYRGVGYNLFMQGGTFTMYEGCVIGVEKDPGLVILAGEFVDKRKNSDEKVELHYHMNNTDGENVYRVGYATKGDWMNLPEAEYFFDAPEGMQFFGWTSQGDAGDLSVRNKNQYIDSGEPVLIDDTKAGSNPSEMFDEKEDEVMHLYALWAPSESSITYADSIVNEKFENLDSKLYPEKYSMTNKSEGETIVIPEVVKEGYQLMGWYVYQNEGVNANWNYATSVNGIETEISYEPLYISEDKKDYKYIDFTNEGRLHQYIVNSDGEATLTVPMKTFGDITLVAHYMELRELKIERDGFYEEDQVYVYKIEKVEDPEFVMYVTVKKDEAVATINNLPAGNYKVTQLSDWSWRNSQSCEDVAHTFINPYQEDKDEQISYVKFSDAVSNVQWLNGNSPTWKNFYN